MSQFNFNRLDLLLKEIQDPYVQENFYRLKQWIEQNDVGGLSSGDGGSSNNLIIGDADIWDEQSKSLAASSLNVTDTIPMVAFRQVIYNINFKDSTSETYKSLKLTVTKDDNSLKDQVSNILGSPISLEINPVINGSNMELQITNNEAFIVDVRIARLVTN